jgi:2-oxoglutarate ferredoxin oxidoreductase subunit gamma
MQTEIVIAGFGGQGVLFVGELLAHAAMDSKLHVTWFPSYGPEMRGGTASCTIIISDQEIGSPVVRQPQGVIALNLPSLDKYEPLVKTSGILVANSSLINRGFNRTDVQTVLIPASELAEQIGDKRLTNMVILGAFLAKSGILSIEIVKNSIENIISKRHHHLLKANYEALDKGYQYVDECKLDLNAAQGDK